MLKLLVRGAIWLNCDDHSEEMKSKESLTEMTKEAKIVLQQTSVMKRMEASQCLISGIKNLYLVSFLCPGPSEEYKRKHDRSWDQAYENKCKQVQLEGFILCRFLKWCLTYRNVIRESLSPFFCKSTRQKRQYDVSSLMAMVNQAACWNSAENDIQKALIEDGGLSFSEGWNMFCCFSRFIDN